MYIINNMIVNNWKIEELLGNYPIEIINEPSQEFDDKILANKKLPTMTHHNISNSHTSIDWGKVDNYHKFFTDNFDEEYIIQKIKSSELVKYQYIIMSFGWNESIAKIPSVLFFQDPLEFFFSKRWEGFIYSEDFNLIIELSHDYYVHSNFKIIN